jgi:hypothetical protein
MTGQDLVIKGSRRVCMLCQSLSPEGASYETLGRRVCMLCQSLSPEGASYDVCACSVAMNACVNPNLQLAHK